MVVTSGRVGGLCSTKGCRGSTGTGRVHVSLLGATRDDQRAGKVTPVARHRASTVVASVRGCGVRSGVTADSSRPMGAPALNAPSKGAPQLEAALLSPSVRSLCADACAHPVRSSPVRKSIPASTSEQGAISSQFERTQLDQAFNDVGGAKGRRRGWRLNQSTKV